MAVTLDEYIDQRIREALEAVDARYTCPRCDVPAYPVPWGLEWQGWCPICGMDPEVEGPPPPPAELKGILG